MRALLHRILRWCKSAWFRFGYRPWARLLHRCNLHHTRRHGPMEDGAYITRCEWCGLHAKEWDGLGLLEEERTHAETDDERREDERYHMGYLEKDPR